MLRIFMLEVGGDVSLVIAGLLHAGIPEHHGPTGACLIITGVARLLEFYLTIEKYYDDRSTSTKKAG